MKRWISGMLVTVLLCFGGCTEKPAEAKTKMDDLMKISTWVMDPALEGKGYWEYTEYTSQGTWIPNEGEADVDDKDVFREERLSVGETRIMAPISSRGGANLNFTIDFEGIVTVEKTEPADDTVLISFDPNLQDQWTGETLISRNGPCKLNVFPVGKKLVFEGVGGALVQNNTLAGKEYYLTIKGYELDGSLMVTAELKLTTLEDEAFPYEEYIQETYRRTGGYAGYGELYAVGEKRTRFCSVELVSYEYSDHYKMMEIFG